MKNIHVHFIKRWVGLDIYLLNCEMESEMLIPRRGCPVHDWFRNYSVFCVCTLMQPWLFIASCLPSSLEQNVVDSIFQDLCCTALSGTWIAPMGRTHILLWWPIKPAFLFVQQPTFGRFPLSFVWTMLLSSAQIPQQVPYVWEVCLRLLHRIPVLIAYGLVTSLICIEWKIVCQSSTSKDNYEVVLCVNQIEFVWDLQLYHAWCSDIWVWWKTFHCLNVFVNVDQWGLKFALPWVLFGVLSPFGYIKECCCIPSLLCPPCRWPAFE